MNQAQLTDAVKISAASIAGQQLIGDFVRAEIVEELEKQLADTRRRLAEVEKERDDAHQLLLESAARIDRDAAAIVKLDQVATRLATRVATAENERDEATSQLTALRNAADGMAAKMRSAVIVLQTCSQIPESAKFMVTELRSELNAYAALIAEGVGKETSL